MSKFEQLLEQQPPHDETPEQRSARYKERYDVFVQEHGSKTHDELLMFAYGRALDAHMMHTMSESLLKENRAMRVECATYRAELWLVRGMLASYEAQKKPWWKFW